MITVKDLFCSYADREVLNGFNLTCPDSAVTALLGANGSGKTTAIRAICGDLPYRGKIEIDGAPAGIDLSRRLSLLPQLLPSPPISVRELVLLGRTPYMGFFGRASRTDREAADEAIERMGLTDIADRAVNTLSGGQRQNAFLAMLLAKDAQNLIFDEPSTFMDAASERGFYRFLDQQRARGKCVLVILHALDRALNHADAITVLSDAHSVFSGTAEECAASGVLDRVFGVHAHRITLDGAPRWICTE